MINKLILSIVTLLLLVFVGCKYKSTVEVFIVYKYQLSDGSTRIKADMCYRLINGSDTTYYAPELDTLRQVDPAGNPTKVPLLDSLGRPQLGIRHFRVPNKDIVEESSKVFPVKVLSVDGKKTD